MKLRILLFVTLVAAMAAFGLFTQAPARDIWPGPLPGPLSSSSTALRQRCVAWHWNGAKGVNDSDFAEEDEVCGRLWRSEHHCTAHPDQDGC